MVLLFLLLLLFLIVFLFIAFKVYLSVIYKLLAFNRRVNENFKITTLILINNKEKK